MSGRMHVKKGNIRIRFVNYMASVILGAATFILFVVIFLGNKYLSEMKDAINDYIASADAAENLESASDYMTEQARSYVQTGELEYLYNYFDEVKLAQRRDKAIEVLKEDYEGLSSVKYLEKALVESQELMKKEYHAMKLASVAYRHSIVELPEEVYTEELSKVEEILPAEEKKKLAGLIMFSEAYQEERTYISDAVNNCVSELKKETEHRQQRAMRVFRNLYWQIELAIIALIVSLIAVYVVVNKYIVAPLLTFRECVERRSILPLIGANELQILAKALNASSAETMNTQEQLRVEAKQDALTEVYNRRYFNEVLERYISKKATFTVILADVDHFKLVNDTYGHEEGDKILKLVADCFKNEFRSDDYICRVGGDEFAVIMPAVGSSLQGIVSEKLARLQRTLRKENTGVELTVTLSVGIAFSDTSEPERIYENADKALYTVKKNGRDGWVFYLAK